MTLVSYRMLNGEVYPFSNSHEHTQDSTGIKVFGSMLVMGFFVIVHLILSIIPFGLYAYMLILLIGIYIGWNKTFPRN